jgi:uncharacterized protein
MSETNTEPTMEEILSSIKKIIADDSSKGLAPPRPRRADPRPPSHDELGERMEPQPDPVDEDVLELTAEAVQPAPPEHAPVAVAPAVQITTAIVSEDTVSASRNALASLSSLIVKPEVTGSDTLEGMVREMLRPMLKDWLDTNLPEVVERMVAKEVARISGR